MNIIDAWKLAKDGQRILGGGHCLTKKTGQIYPCLFTVSETAILSNDWEVVKENKKREWLMMEAGYLAYNDSPFQCFKVEIKKGAKVIVEWEE